METAEFDREWFLSQMKGLELTQAQLARSSRIDPARISRLLNNRADSPLTIPEAKGLASALNRPLHEILRRGGIPLDSLHSLVPVTHYVNGLDGLAKEFAAKEIRRATGPYDLPPSAFALQVRSANTAFELFDRWTIYCTGTRADPDDLVGRMALVRFTDGKMCLGILRVGYDEGTYSVQLTPEIVHTARVQFAMGVLWLRPPTIEL